MTARNVALKTKITAWLAVLVWMGVIFAFSHQAHSGAITERYLGAFNVAVRKAGHVSEYAVLFVLLRRALLCTVDGAYYEFLVPLLLSILYAISDEYHQSFVAGRSSSPADVVVDSGGALLGYAAVRLWIRLSRQRQMPD